MLDISIVTYNSGKWLVGYFESLINQDYPISMLNIYVTDNGSTDNTLDICNGFVQKQLFANFHIESKDNLGFGCGHNNNFQYCKSAFILVTNVDLTYEHDSILKLVDFAKNDESITVSWEMRQKPFEHPKIYNPITLETSWSSSACVLLRKSALDKVGGYEPKIFMYGEDVELSWRLRANGYKLKYYPKAVCWHHTYEESKFKKMQFLGSTLANLYLRARFGTLQQIQDGEAAYCALINSPEGYDGQRKDLEENFVIYKNNYQYFNESGFQNKLDVKFVNTWDYEIIRDGAFYENKPFPQATPLVSVLIRTYKGRSLFLKEAISSVLNQTYHNFEIIIVEDGDNSQQNIVNSFDDCRIKYFSADKVGRCVTGNIALEKSIGEYCIFLDDDDYFYSDHLEVLVSEILLSDDLTKAVYTSAFEVKTSILKDASANCISYSENESYKVLIKEKFNHLAILEHNFIPIQTILFARELYEKLGGFEVDLDNLEDWNLWTRYSSICDFIYVDKTTSIYRTPLCVDDYGKRHSGLVSYYDAALLKQDQIIVSGWTLSTIRKHFLIYLNMIREQRKVIEQLNERIIEQSKSMNEHAAAQNKLINELLLSKSWRITKPLRQVMLLLKRVRQICKV